MREVATGDGRTLAVEEWGAPEGTPVLYMHGTPMSRLARYPKDELFTELNVRLITFDRPGFGASTAFPGRRVVDAANDVATVADALGLDRFPIFGVSGGGPHALAFAASFPDRVVRVAALACPAPCDAEGLDWTAGMMESNQKNAAAAKQGPKAFAEHLRKTASENLGDMLPAEDKEVLARPEVQRMLGAAYTEAVRPGLGGWVDDEIALFAQSWGFNPGTIAAPAWLWHGDLDTVVPPAHSEWLAQLIPTATFTRGPQAGHTGHFDATPDVLRWLISGQR